MTKQKTLVAIKQKIEQLNKKIDLLIIAGKDYKKFSTEHYNLVRAYEDIKKGIYA